MPVRRRDLGRLNPNCGARRHGDYSAYRQGCRCSHAREDDRLYNKRGREGRRARPFVPSIGSARRIQALAVLGWRWTDLADRLGVSWQAVQRIALQRSRVVHVTTAERVRRLYAELSERQGPSALTRARALSKGWASPLQWADIDDPDAVPDRGEGVVWEPEADHVVVDEFLGGRLPVDRLSELDMVEVYRRMTASGASRAKVRHRLGISWGRIDRIAEAA